MASHVFITGTNSGIGRLTALALARRGHRVFATMRDPTGAHRAEADALVAAAAQWPGTIAVYELELASERSVGEAAARVLQDAGHVDAVINNAGLTTMGLAETMTDQQTLYQLDVAVVGPHRVLRALLPSMRARKSGVLVFVTDTLGRLVLPMMGIHCAAKAGIEALADAYRIELQALGIESTIVQPGIHPTGFVDRLEVGDDHERMQGYGALTQGLQRMGEIYREAITGPQAPDPQLVADAIVMVVELAKGSRPDRFVVDGRDGAELLRVNDAHRRAQKEVLAKLKIDGVS